jgi:hypothetical protein
LALSETPRITIPACGFLCGLFCRASQAGVLGRLSIRNQAFFFGFFSIVLFDLSRDRELLRVILPVYG